MKLSDLKVDERIFLAEASDFEQSFLDLITFIHDQNPGVSLARKYELAQELVANLSAKGLICVVVVKYVKKNTGIYDAVGAEAVAFELVAAAWDNPYFWGSHGQDSGASFVGVDYNGRSCIALEPTPLGKLLLDQESTA